MYRREGLAAVVVRRDTTIDQTIRQMAIAPQRGGPAGIAVVVDADDRVIGIVTDGDARRAYAAGVPFDQPVERIMVRDPVTIPDTVPRGEMLRYMFDQVRSRPRLRDYKVDKILVLGRDGRLGDIVSFFDLALENDIYGKRIVVVGVGHIGLPMAACLASLGFRVVGVDLDTERVAEYRAGRCGIRETGLGDLLRETMAKGRLRFTGTGAEAVGEVYIVCIGTPVKPDGTPEYGPVIQVAEQVGSLLKRGDLVILRSTVPVGTTRRLFLPTLEKFTGLTAGVDYHVAYAPERAVAGKVLEELRTLPQVVAGLSDRCVDEATRLLSHLASCVVKMESLEAAELVKLANNSFRDLCFAFANELAMLCAQFNIDAFHLIAAANEGYPRNTIPTPSPGVGGYCLSKDPLLYSYPLTDGSSFRPQLPVAGRAVHAQTLHYVVDQLREFARRTGKDLRQMAVLLVGVAFKGQPETADVRESVVVEVQRMLRAQAVAEIRGFDFVVDPGTIARLGLRPVSLEDGFDGTDAVLFLNNHPEHAKIHLGDLVDRANRPLLFFDGWHQFNKEVVSGMDGVVYATMGFCEGTV